MKETNTTYFQNLMEGMAGLIRSVICENSINPFRRGQQVRLGAPSGPSDDFHLVYLGKKQIDTEKGSFSCPLDKDTFLVFRSPVRVQVNFLLYGNQLSHQTRFNALDKLSCYFFDNKTVDPFIPDSYKEYPALYKRLASLKAEVGVSDTLNTIIQPAGKPENFFQFRFTYVALYHSGNPLREDRKVKQRTIDYGNENRERSAL